MTTDTIRSTCPSDFDAELPSLAHDDVQNPPELTSRAVEEVMRHSPVVCNTMRTASE